MTLFTGFPSPDGKTIAFASDTAVRVIDANTAEAVYMAGHDDWVGWFFLQTVNPSFQSVATKQ